MNVPQASSTKHSRLMAWLMLICLAMAWLPPGQADEFLLPTESTIIGELRIIKARYEDTLIDIARRYNLGYREIILANPNVDPWLPGEGTEVVLPTRFILPDAPHEGIVLNVAEMRLYYFPQAQPGQPAIVATYPVSIGRIDWRTPLGTTQVIKKTTSPSWWPPASIREEYQVNGDLLPRRILPGPDNPLGSHALSLGIPGYLIHGTNKPFGIGMRVTHGCVRLYPEDIARLYMEVAIGTPVTIVNQPYKAAWENGRLYIEAHPPLAEDWERFAMNQTAAVRAVLKTHPVSPKKIDWPVILQIASKANGIPTLIRDAP